MRRELRYILLSWICCCAIMAGQAAPGRMMRVGQAPPGDTVSLAGQWGFRMDPGDRGLAEHWWKGEMMDETVKLPGSMAENGKGDDITVDTKWTASIYDSSWFFDPRMARYREPGNLKIPFWLTPAKHYVGVAWYQKEVVVPAGWEKKRLRIYLERPHSATTVWVDGDSVGAQYGFCTAQEFVLAGGLRAGRHVITLRIDNRIGTINVGQDSHSLTDQTQGNWNGVVGRMLLTAGASVWLEDVQVFPDVAHKKVRVRMQVRSVSGTGAGAIFLRARTFNTPLALEAPGLEVKYSLRGGKDSIEVDMPMGDSIALWDEFDPALYRLTASLSGGEERVVEFGMRVFGINGTRFEINGRPVYLRGTVENCVFPLTGYAPMDEPAWERVFRIARSYGLNHMRFHSYCPPEAAFAAADRVGFYLQPEGPSWANHGSSLGDGKPVDQFIYDETERMDRVYGNHASYCLLAYGNEPRGSKQVEYLTRFVEYWKQRDSRRVYTGASVGNSWPLVPENEYMVKAGPRGLTWKGLPETMTDYGDVIGKFKVPYVTHEMGQWCAYPDFSEILKYSGVYKAKNFELFQDDLGREGMGDEARQFLMASGKLQVLCYKTEIEKSLRTPGGAGFQLLSLNDYTGQGTALVGVLNAFWGEKGYVGPEAFSRFCNSTVPLLRIPKFVFTSDEELTAGVEICHYGKEALHDAVIDWVLKDVAGHVYWSGSFDSVQIPVGGSTAVGRIRIALSKVRAAAGLKLEVRIRGTRFVNDWDCWVYPVKPEPSAWELFEAKRAHRVKNEIYYCRELDERARKILENGGSVFLNAYGKVVKGKEVVMNFTPVFWNTSWFKMRPPHTLGILLDRQHPLFRNFPTEDYEGMQWWDVVNRAQVMHLEDFPAGFRPLVQPIDTWFMNRRLGLIFEARVGKGRLIVSGADLGPDTGPDRPAARQLYYSIQRYMQWEDFAPAMAVDFDVVKDLFVSGSRLVYSSYSKSAPDELRKAPIDRKALVMRHTVVNEAADSLSSLSLGNGRFAFTVDVTGLQSFPEHYDKGIPLGTQSQWGWHSWVDSHDYRLEETMKEYMIHGRAVPYAIQSKEPARKKQASDWLRENPHRLQLGCLGFQLIKKDGTEGGLEDVHDIHQELDLWKGEIRSRYVFEGDTVRVSTVVHPGDDLVSVSVQSMLVARGRIRVRLRLPFPTGQFSDEGDNWKDSARHASEILSKEGHAVSIVHRLDTTQYFIRMEWTGRGYCRKVGAHEYLLTPMRVDDIEQESFTFSCRFSEKAEGGALPGWEETARASDSAWGGFWMKGGAVDFSGSSDPRAFELERRVVLSQYLMRIQCAGDQPPQETGLTYNSWYGKPHLEMHWWHGAHDAVWGRPELLERSMDWYIGAAAGARQIALRQGYAGLRWPKMTDPAGRETPSSVGAFLIWQEPHFIYFTELLYRQHPDAATLAKYKDLVFATADFMASYARYDSVGRRYVLGSPLIPAQERFAAGTTVDPAFELAYWRWALSVAQQWRARLGMGVEANWRKVEEGLAELPRIGVRAGDAMSMKGEAPLLYLPTESDSDAYTNIRYRGDHPAVLGAFGFLPMTKGMDTAVMRRTFDWVWKNWKWEETWGWDFPLMAMTATRLGMPERAVDALLMPVRKNIYLPNGHNYQDGRLRLYLPGNGGLLAAIALMCAGYDGCERVNPGFPAEGWKVRWEGLEKMP